MEAIFLTWLVFSIIVAVAANARNRSAFGWFFIAIIISPLLALILVLVMKPASSQDYKKYTPQKSIDTITYDGDQDITHDKYQLYLTKKYSIERNSTLEKFIINDEIFPSLEEAFKHADSIEKMANLEAKKESLKKAYLVITCEESENAYKSGIRPGDYILEYNENPIKENKDISNAIEKSTLPTANILIYRNGKTHTLIIKSGKMGINGEIKPISKDLYDQRLEKFLQPTVV